MNSRQGVYARVRQTGRLLRSEGVPGVAARVLEQCASTLRPTGNGQLPVRREDLMRAAEIAAGGWELPGPATLVPGEGLTVAWVCVPPGGGSGGHTTMFRLAAALEDAGHRCVIYLQDQHAWSIEQHRRTIRQWWPWLRAEIRDLADGIEDAHAVFATAWLTAYPVLASPARGVRFYLVQDFEPSFFAAGSEALLAEATYRFGFHGVTAGKWLAELLRRDYGMPADHFDFGCDVGTYRIDRAPGAANSREGVCCYCRPSTPRRAHALAMVALDLLAARQPAVPIHLFGESVRGLTFPATQHGTLTPQRLNELYNRCIAGLALSATNVSLVPQEMLAAGCIPVVNDAEQSRVVLENPHVVYAPPTPFGLAAALEDLVLRPRPERAAAAEAGAASMRGASWDDAGKQVERVVRAVVAAAASSRLLAAPS
jgi:glycosyltransferase involved in cell wall biosynthesis